MGLADRENPQGLSKIASASGADKNIEKLIRDQAYSDITDKFKELRPYIVGISIIEKISDTTVLAGASLSLPGKSLIVPIVYYNGLVDATTFIYNQETDIMLGLTVKVVSLLTSDSNSIDGEAVSGSKIGDDTGSIHKLFVPPRTFSPKIASGSLLLRMLEKSADLRAGLRDKMNADDDFKSEIIKGYGEDIIKVANIDNLNDVISDYEVFWDKSSILKQANKSDMLQDFYRNGFAIKENPLLVTRKARERETLSDRVMKQVGGGSFESFSSKDIGFFDVFDRDGKKDTIVSAQGIYSCPEVVSLGKNRISFEDGEKYVAKKVELPTATSLKPYYKGEVSKGCYLLLLSGKDEPIYLLRASDDVVSSLGSDRIPVNGRFASIIVSTGLKSEPSEINGNIYVGGRNIKVILDDITLNNKRFDPLKIYELDKTASTNAETINISHDGVEFFYKQASFSGRSLVSRLLDEGFEKESVYQLIKEAKEAGNVSMEVVNAKIDMLTKMIMNVAQSQQGAVSAPPTDAMPQEEVPVAATPPEEMASAPQGEELPPMDGVDNQLPQEQEQGLNEDGMNMSMDAQTLQMALSQLKNSPAMDMSVIASIASTPDISGVIKDHQEEIQMGVSGLGRILMNIMTKRDTVEANIGKAKYKQLVSTLKPLFLKMSDTYADIYALKIESDVERN